MKSTLHGMQLANTMKTRDVVNSNECILLPRGKTKPPMCGVDRPLRYIQARRLQLLNPFSTAAPYMWGQRTQITPGTG